MKRTGDRGQSLMAANAPRNSHDNCDREKYKELQKSFGKAHLVSSTDVVSIYHSIEEVVIYFCFFN